MTRAAMPSSASASAAFSASCTVIPAPMSATSSLVARAQDAAAADRELLVGRVEHRRRRAERAQVRDALRVRHRRDELRGLVRVARVEHGRSVDGAQRRDVLERHLRRAVLADRDARVRAAERERRAADRRHADEVVGAREERGERRRERPPARPPAGPTAAATSCCSAMYISKYRSGCAFANVSANVEFETSPSRATTSGRAAPSAASASPYALRVATSVPSS